MRAVLVLLLIPAAGAQPLPGWMTGLMPKSDVPAVRKANRILEELQAPHRQAVEYRINDAEANIWLQEAARANPNTGFSDPMISFYARNNVRAVFDFDLDRFLSWRPQWRARAGRLLRLLPSGSRRVAVQVQFTTEQRKLQMQVVDARLNGRYVAPPLLNLGLRLLRRWKEGRLNVVDGIPLPWDIHHLVTTNGELRIGT